MARHNRFKRSQVRQVSRAAKNAAPMEDLEARLLLTVYNVTTNLDVVDPLDGALSLREAITAANSNAVFSDAPAGDPPSVAVDSIVFTPGIWGETIQLVWGELPITEALRITGPAAPDTMTVSGSDAMRIFNITGNNVSLSNLVITDGLGQGGGGAIRISGGGTLNITSCTIQNSFALTAQGRPAWGGGILNQGSTVNILRTTIGTTDPGTPAGNGAANGGGIYSEGGTINLVGGVAITGNTATNNGAGIYMDGGTLNMERNIPTIWIGTAHSDPEGNVGIRAVTYNVSLSHPSSQPVTVDYVADSLPGDTATAGADYQAISGTLTFPPGTTTGLITVNFISDLLGEGDETFTITLSNPVNGMIGNAQSVATIEDASVGGLPNVSIGLTHRDFEGDTSPSSRQYNVALSEAAGVPVTVDYVVASLGGNTATAGVDYLPVSGTLTFPAGVLTMPIVVPFFGDNALEPAESFTITLSNVSAAAQLTNAVSTAWIENDDFVSTVSDNVATGSGGGLFASHATVRIAGVAFDANEGLDGGGMHLAHSDVIFGNDVDQKGNVGSLGSITGGTALRYGGGVFMSGGNVTIAGGGTVLDPLGIGQVSITGNNAINGGGIYQDDGTLSLVDASVSANTTSSMPLFGVPVSLDGTVAASLNFATGAVTGTITGAITVGGVPGGQITLGTFTTTVGYVLAHPNTPVDVTVTIGGAVVGVINCILTVTPVLGTGTADGTFAGAGLVVGSGVGTFTGVPNPPIVPETDFALTMAATATLTGPDPVASTGLGAGIFAANGTTTGNRVQILANAATAGGGGVAMPILGGGIYALYHDLRLDSTVINNNSATGNGGGIYLEHSDADLSQVTLSANTVTSVDGALPTAGVIGGSITGGARGIGTITAAFLGGGAGPQPLGGSVSGVGSGTFEGTITINGQIVGVVTGFLTVSPMGTGNITGTVSTFGSGGGLLTATISGGGLSGSIGGTVVLEGAGVFPTSGLGAGVYVTQGSTLELNSSTVTGNSAPIGGGVYIAYPAPSGSSSYAGEAGSVESTSSIIAQNTATSGELGPDVYGVITAERTLIGKGVGAKVYGSGNLVGHTIAGINAKLAPRDATGGFFDLLPSSPAINTGSNPANEMTDTRGWPRLFGAKYDMGAVEHQPDLGPRIDVEIDNRHHVETYNFGAVPLDSSKAVEFTIRNEGTSALVIDSAILTTGTIFALSPSNGATAGDNWTILPGQTFTFTITASPDGVTPDALDILTIASSDPTRPTHVLAVTVNQGPPVPDLAASNVTLVEGNSGTKNAVFTVSLSSPSESTVTVQYATANGTATAGSDYIAASGLLTFAPGQTTQTVTVKVNGDKMDEDDETFFLDLTNAVGASINGQPIIAGDPDDHTHQATATIVDDDGPPAIRINDVRAIEGDVGVTNFVFTVSLSVVSGKTITVNYTTANGTALAGSDYVAQSGMLTFAPGVATQTITIAVNGDTTYEFDEAFFVNLSSANNATIADAQGLGTIRNDDVAPTLNIDSPTIAEGTGGSTFLNFEATLSAGSERPVTAKYATVGGTATSGRDFVPASGIVVFAPGETSRFIAVSIVTDALNELNETFQVKLSKVTGATLGLGTGTGTITNDDALPTLSINDPAAILEGNSGFRKLFFTVTLSAASGQTVLVNYATAPNTATTPSDFVTKIGTLTFAPGETVKTFFVLVAGDTTIEGPETFFVDLSAPTNATIADSQGVGTITNDD